MSPFPFSQDAFDSQSIRGEIQPHCQPRLQCQISPGNLAVAINGDKPKFMAVPGLEDDLHRRWALPRGAAVLQKLRPYGFLSVKHVLTICVSPVSVLAVLTLQIDGLQIPTFSRYDGSSWARESRCMEMRLSSHVVVPDKSLATLADSEELPAVSIAVTESGDGPGCPLGPTGSSILLAAAPMSQGEMESPSPGIVGHPAGTGRQALRGIC
jgi:hypothetical protein